MPSRSSLTDFRKEKGGKGAGGKKSRLQWTSLRFESACVMCAPHSRKMHRAGRRSAAVHPYARWLSAQWRVMWAMRCRGRGAGGRLGWRRAFLRRISSRAHASPRREHSSGSKNCSGSYIPPRTGYPQSHNCFIILKRLFELVFCNEPKNIVLHGKAAWKMKRFGKLKIL